MRIKKFAGAVCTAAGVLALGSVGLSSAAFASSSNAAVNGTVHCDPSSAQCIQGPGGPPFNPVIEVSFPDNPVPPFVTIAPNCPAFISTVPWTLNFINGNAVTHGTMNKNGDWGGSTAEGQADLTTGDGTTQYTGHLQEWGGAGQNSNPGGQPMNQSEYGFTVNFNGSGADGNISIHANSHSTTNNSGVTTSSVNSGTVTCS